MEEDHYTGDGDHQSMDEDLHTTDEEEDDHATGWDQHTTDEDLHTTDEEDQYVNMETSAYRLSGPGALLRNQLKGPGFRLVQLRARTGQGLGVTRAIVQEKLSRANASINYGVYSFTHPIHPERRRAARDVASQKKSLAAERRAQREAKARSRAEGLIAAAREGRIATLQEGVH